jgi:hypothetical protein
MQASARLSAGRAQPCCSFPSSRIAAPLARAPRPPPCRPTSFVASSSCNPEAPQPPGSPDQPEHGDQRAARDGPPSGSPASSSGAPAPQARDPVSPVEPYSGFSGRGPAESLAGPRLQPGPAANQQAPGETRGAADGDDGPSSSGAYWDAVLRRLSSLKRSRGAAARRRRTAPLDLVARDTRLRQVSLKHFECQQQRDHCSNDTVL